MARQGGAGAYRRVAGDRFNRRPSADRPVLENQWVNDARRRGCNMKAGTA